MIDICSPLSMCPIAAHILTCRSPLCRLTTDKQGQLTTKLPLSFVACLPPGTTDCTSVQCLRPNTTVQLKLASRLQAAPGEGSSHSSRLPISSSPLTPAAPSWHSAQPAYQRSSNLLHYTLLPLNESVLPVLPPPGPRTRSDAG